MSITRHLRRPVQLCAIVGALLLPAVSEAAPATGDPLAKERYYMSFSTHDPAPQEQYLASYGTPEPLSAAQSHAPTNEAPWLPIGLSIAGVLAIVVLSAAQVGRVRLRRRHAAHMPA